MKFPFYYFKQSRRVGAMIVLSVSLITHLAFWGRPNEVVFDEVHMGKYVGAYFTGKYYFDVHPQLARMLMAGISAIGGAEPHNQFEKIGEQYPNREYLLLRLLPLLSGILLPIVIYYLALELKFSPFGASLAGLFVGLENALLVQSRFMLTDIMLTAAGFAALYFYIRFRRTKQWRDVGLAAFLAGVAVSIKWTGLAFVGLPLIIEMTNLFHFREWRKQRGWWMGLASLILIPITMYLLVAAVHLLLLPKSGIGDAFHTREFQHTLAGSPFAADPSIKGKNLAQKFLEMQKEMYKANQGLTTPHQYASRWYTWPIMYRPIYYWSLPDMTHIYLLGNPIIWWASSLAMIGVAGGLFWTRGERRRLLLILSGGYLLNLLPFAAIGRVQFLYHYLPSLVFAILGLAHLLDRRKRRQAALALVLVALVSFIFFAPLSYGLPVTNAELQRRMWITTWR